MSALIKIKELVIDRNNYYLKYHSRFIVVPFVISYNNYWIEKNAIVQKSYLSELGLLEKDFSKEQLFTSIKTYCVEYKDSTNNNNEIHFQHQEDAEKFLKELESCINDFYNNANAYIKFIN